MELLTKPFVRSLATEKKRADGEDSCVKSIAPWPNRAETYTYVDCARFDHVRRETFDAHICRLRPVWPRRETFETHILTTDPLRFRFGPGFRRTTYV